MPDVLIYGASGYMGKLCAAAMLERDLRPVLAGRGDSVTAVARANGCEAAVFGLDEPARIEQHLAGVNLLVNLAGPFQTTQQPLIRACMAAGCHYIDIAGEVDEMRSAFAYDEAAREKAVSLRGPEAYRFTAQCVRAVAAKVIGGEFAPGFRTPAWYGEGLLADMEDVEWM